MGRRDTRETFALALACALIAIPLASAETHDHDGHTMEGENVRTPPPQDTGYSGGPVTVKLYGHIFDLLQPVPINTQPMIDIDLARGFGTPSATGVHGEGLNMMRFYSSAGFVEYNVSTQQPRVHPERGLSYDIELDGGQDIMAYWYMSVKPANVPQLGSPGEGGPEQGLMPNFAVKITMRQGDAVGADLDKGTLYAEGMTTLTPEQWMVQGPIEFAINLGKAQVAAIDGTESFNVKVEWFNLDQNGQRVTQRDWILHTGTKYPNRIELPVKNPIALYYVHPQPVGDSKIAIHTMFNSPFGNYDIDPASLKMEITGPSPAKTISPPALVQKTWVHNHHFEPVKAVWVWDWRADGAAPGEYTVTVSGTNTQGTATATKSYAFKLEDAKLFTKEGEEIKPQGADETGAPEKTGVPGLSPAFAALAGLGAALLVSITQRRRGNE